MWSWACKSINIYIHKPTQTHICCVCVALCWADSFLHRTHVYIRTWRVAYLHPWHTNHKKRAFFACFTYPWYRKNRMNSKTLTSQLAIGLVTGIKCLDGISCKVKSMNEWIRIIYASIRPNGIFKSLPRNEIFVLSDLLSGCISTKIESLGTMK